MPGYLCTGFAWRAGASSRINGLAQKKIRAEKAQLLAVLFRPLSRRVENSGKQKYSAAHGGRESCEANLRIGPETALHDLRLPWTSIIAIEEFTVFRDIGADILAGLRADCTGSLSGDRFVDAVKVVNVLEADS